MTSNQNNIYYFLLFLVISSWFLSDYFRLEEVVLDRLDSHYPDYFSTGYYKGEMNKEGVLKNELNAKKMTHYSDDERTHLESPVMTLYSPDTPPWIIKSETAILEADGDHLQLVGNVYISRLGSRKLRPFKIKALDLKVTLSTNYAETSRWAEIIDDQNRTEGEGLEMTFIEPINIKFLSKVKGRYVFN